MMTRREKLRQEAIGEIKGIAWDLLKNKQPVTIQQIAKSMGMTPPAFYTYFSSREALMAELVVDALTTFHGTLSAPFPDTPQSIGANIQTLFVRYRSWAVMHPNAFSLFAGNPVFGFESDQVPEMANEVYRFILERFIEADQAGLIKKFKAEYFTADYAGILARIRDRIHPEADLSVVHHVIRMVSQVHGLISMELSNRFTLYIGDWDTFFQGHLHTALAEIGICP